MDLCIDLHIGLLLQHRTDTIIDIIVMETDAKIYISHPLKNLLEIKYKEKNNKYLLPCMYKRKKFTLFYVSVDSLLGIKSQMIIKTIPGALPPSDRSHHHRHTIMSTIS